MTVQDMDITLNISSGPVASASKKSDVNDDDSVLSSMRGLKSQAFRKSNVTSADKKAQNVSTKQSFNTKQRVKQQSLSAVVAKQLKHSSIVNKPMIAQKSSKLQRTHIKDKQPEHKPIQPSVKGQDSKDLTKPSLNIDNETSSVPTISFTKVTKENFGKTLLARKRNITEANSKKSLASVFSKQNESESTQFNVLAPKEKVDTDESTVPKKRLKFEEPKKSFQEAKTVSFDDKPEKYSGKPDFKHKSNAGSHKDSYFTPKSVGKISSLFRHNPEIPNIGQRFVKPINEPVFTGTSFADFNIHPFMISNLEQNMQITKMTTVQQKAIPQIFSGKDILIRSQTGSGKTLTYALPIVELLHKIRPKLNRNDGLRALIVVPTRELALQTYECFLKLIKPFTWIVPGYLSGGEKRKAEKARLRKGCNILVGTPGRILDHIKHTEALKLNEVKYFVLDEADRMFDMGYEKDISGIVSALKISTPNENTEYDALKLLRQNVKKVFTDQDIDHIENNNASENMKRKQDAESEDEIEKEDAVKDKKKVYHSSSESDSEECFVKSKTANKRKIDIKTTVQTESTVPQGGNDHVNESGRQTILLSATLTQAVEKLAGLTMENPVFVDAAKENLEMTGGDANDINEDLVVPQSVTQTYVVTPPKLRMVTLSAYIAGKCQTFGQHKILVFMATQDMIDYHTDMLSAVLTKPMDGDDEDSDPLVDVEFFKLHGNMNQKERMEVFKTFRKAKSGVLLCTDVASRGLDLPKVDCVVQYTGPLSARDYVHRIGRTARAGCSGSATIFLTPPEVEFVRMLESRRIRIKQEDMDHILSKLLNPLSIHNTPHSAAIAVQNEFEELVIKNSKLREKAYRAYTSWVRFYSSYPRDMREIFNRKELHLGHYAKSFALRDTPQRIGGLGKTLRNNDTSKKQHNNRLCNERPDGESQRKPRNQDGESKTGLLKKVRMLNTSEYGSGLETVKKPKKS